MRHFISLIEAHSAQPWVDGDTFTGICGAGYFRRCRLVNGIWTDYDLTPPPPEPSPVEKAIDEMMAKRKAKREMADANQAAPGRALSDYAKEIKGMNQSHDLGRAMQKLTHWELPKFERLANYRCGV